MYPGSGQWYVDNFVSINSTSTKKREFGRTSRRFIKRRLTLGTQVGEGEFGYDPTTTTFVQTSILVPEIPTEGFEVQSALEAFSINVAGESFGLDDQPGLVTWWFDSNNNPGQQLVDPRRPLPNIIENSWVFPEGGLFLFAEKIFNMNITENISNALWVGDWDSIIFDSPTNPEPIFASGEWAATLRPQAVPEPTTTLGLLAFSALGVASAWKSKRN